MIHIGIGLGIPYCSNAGGLSQFNPIAVARINAIYAAGGTCPVGQTTATSLLSDFINAEQSSGRWAQHRNIFIPGWGNAAANAIGIVTGNSGQFSASGVTHGAGFVQGDGSTGFFSAQTNASSLGVTNESLTIFFLSTLADSRTDSRFITSVFDSSTQEFMLSSSSATQIRFDAFNNTSSTNMVNLARANHIGIITASRFAGKWQLARRTSAGYTLLLDRTGTAGGSIPVNDIVFLAQRFSVNTITGHNNGRFGAYGIGLGLSQSDVQAFSANLRTLWEGLFQQTIPS